MWSDSAAVKSVACPRSLQQHANVTYHAAVAGKSQGSLCGPTVLLRSLPATDLSVNLSIAASRKS